MRCAGNAEEGGGMGSVGQVRWVCGLHRNVLLLSSFDVSHIGDELLDVAQILKVNGRADPANAMLLFRSFLCVSYRRRSFTKQAQTVLLRPSELFKNATKRPE